MAGAGAQGPDQRHYFDPTRAQTTAALERNDSSRHLLVRFTFAPVPSHQPKRATRLLYERGSALHPITVVDIENRTNHAMIRLVGVAANHAVDLALAGGSRPLVIAKI